MKKVYSLVLFALLLNAFALQAQVRKHCHTDEIYKETVLQHPEILARDLQLEEFTQNFIRNNQGGQRHTNPNGTTSTLYIIPLVFHIIHEYGPENISDAQVIDAVNILNRDYRKLNPDTANIIPDFQALAADIEIEFRLATIDPNGFCTNGIDRWVSFRTHIGDDLAKFNPWPREKYLNIWTVADFSASHATAAAYAYRPGTMPSPAVDGVIALSNYVGSIGTSNVFNSRTLTHEIGHVFNLIHPWGGTNQTGVACGNDSVGDTPITKGWDICPSSNYDVCNPGTNENFQNYMDYSYCDCMFTYGQKTRMIAALNSTTAGRNNLWASTNLDSTGTNGLPPQTCEPIADFFPRQDHICDGDSVQFISVSSNTNTVNYQWSFPLGNPSTSTLQNPYVTYSAPGVYNASLTLSNGTGSDLMTKNLVVSVSGAPTFTPNYVDSFESAAAFPGDGYTINNAGTGWTRATNTGYSGTGCLRMLNYNTGQTGLVDSYVTPAINLFGYNAALLTFQIAYARKDLTKTDILKIYYSLDCGQNWTHRRTLSGSQLVTHANVTSGFVPSSQADWALVSVANISIVNNKPDVRFKFEFTSGGDNNLYIDDINLSAAPVGVNELTVAALNFEVYPNPSTDAFSITFGLPEFSKAEVKITDVLGRVVKTVVKDQLSAGNHEYQINSGEFGKGIYLVCLKAGEISIVKKLVIE